MNRRLLPALCLALCACPPPPSPRVQKPKAQEPKLPRVVTDPPTRPGQAASSSVASVGSAQSLAAAEQALRAGDAEAAEAAFASAPDQPLNVAYLTWLDQGPAAAGAKLEEVTEAKPLSAQAQLGLARWARHARDWPTAERAARRARTLDASLAEAWRTEGEAMLWRSAERSEAVSQGEAQRRLQQALELEPEDTRTRGLLALAELKREAQGWVVDPGQAAQRVRAALPPEPEADRDAELGPPQTAEQAAPEPSETVCEQILGSPTAPAHLARAELSWQARLAPEALAELDQAVAQEPGLASELWALRLRFRAGFAAGQGERAINRLQEGVSGLPASAGPRRQACGLAILGAARVRLERFGSGRALLGQALQRDPKLPLAELYLGVALHRDRTLRDLERALQHYTRAINLSPDFGDARCYRAAVLHDTNDFAGALADLERAADLPGVFPRPFARFLKGRCLFQLGRDEEALRELSLFLDESPPSPAIDVAQQILQEIAARRQQ